jgi:hypothetical protein
MTETTRQRDDRERSQRDQQVSQVVIYQDANDDLWYWDVVDRDGNQTITQAGGYATRDEAEGSAKLQHPQLEVK